MTEAEMAAALRARGWVCREPAAAELPEPVVGQVWVSGQARVEPRTVVAVGGRRPWFGVYVSFTTPTRQPDPEYGPEFIRRSRFLAWARKTGARPL